MALSADDWEQIHDAIQLGLKWGPDVLNTQMRKKISNLRDGEEDFEAMLDEEAAKARYPNAVE